MIKSIVRYSFIILILLATSLVQAQNEQTDLLIIGGGASGTTAGIQASRMGVKTLIIEETEWLGGMLTAAGVSAIDGNHQMPSGLWGEFRQKLYDHYGGPKAVETGWVSNTLFEPAVGNQILQELAKEDKLTIWFNTSYQKVDKLRNGWQVTVQQGNKLRTIKSKILIDATELGDVLAEAGVAYDIGMDSRAETGEAFAPEEANDIVQDLTYVVILKDYGKGSDKTIPKPEGYDPNEFSCACDVSDPAADQLTANDCFKMMQYGRLPNDKYMINWPKCGNDIYLNIIEKNRKERLQALKEAKAHTLRFIYYLQTALGFENLGIATEEFPTKDNFPMLPYHRESRRMHGIVQLNLNHVTKPYAQDDPLYRTGIAVGDYTIDHHHLKNPSAPEIDFVKIRVPSYNVPLGALIPENMENFIVAEKSISVTNIVNGATRLQPVVLGIGQAAGALAAIAIQKGVQPEKVKVRNVQRALLAENAYIMPFIDIKPDDVHFTAIQRIGATGILKGTGIPYKWANQTWFYPDLPMSEYELWSGLMDFYPQLSNDWSASGEFLTMSKLINMLKAVKPSLDEAQLIKDWKKLRFEKDYSANLKVTRRMIAVIIDHYLNPFALDIDMNGSLKKFINQTEN